MSSFNQVPDSPWHLEFLRMSESDSRRDCRKCIHYNNQTRCCKCTKCPYFMLPCGGSSHCSFYENKSDQKDELYYIKYLVSHLNEYSVEDFRYAFVGYYGLPEIKGDNAVYMDIEFRKFIRAFYYDSVKETNNIPIENILNKLTLHSNCPITVNSFFNPTLLTKKGMGTKTYFHTILLYISYVKYFIDPNEENKKQLYESITYYFNSFGVHYKGFTSDKVCSTIKDTYFYPFKFLLQCKDLTTDMLVIIHKQFFECFCQMFFLKLGSIYMRKYFRNHDTDNSNEFYKAESEKKRQMKSILPD